MRKICYISGTRADFGLMKSTLQLMQASPSLALEIIVTGMHLETRYGNTVQEIENSGLNITERIQCQKTEVNTGASMATSLGEMIIGMTKSFVRNAPDIVLLLGDRGEMLAGAISALHLNIPVAHIHGGERSGTIDESIRHAISKLSHFHFVSTQQSRERLIRMGENPEHIYVVGAPGLDGIENSVSLSRNQLVHDFKLDPDKKIALFVFHPVVQEAHEAANQTRTILDALLKSNAQIIALKPNSDAGSSGVCEVLEKYQLSPQFQLYTHLSRDIYLSFVAASDLMIGNSSSGIIEAGSFGTPVINVGSRQNLRERNNNIIDIDTQTASLEDTVMKSLNMSRHPLKNIYGDGHAGERIVELLQTIPLTSKITSKVNAY